MNCRKVPDKFRQLLRIAPALLLVLATEAFSTPTPARTSQIGETVSGLNQDELLTGVQIRINNSILGPAVSYMVGPGSFLVEYNPKIFLTLNRPGKDFVMFHELGHIRLGHVASPYPGPLAAKEFELEADAFAAFAFRKFKGGKKADLADFFKVIKAMDTTPTGDERVDLCEAILETSPR